MSRPTFSVIVPAYNAQDTLRTTVASVLNQSVSDFEVIIVDDGSTNGTLQAMLDLGCADMRVRLISQPNSGVSAARNYGASLAKGRFLAFLDADDQWEQGKLQSHLELHERNPNTDASFAKVSFCSDASGEMKLGRTVSNVSHRSLSGFHEIGNVVVQNPVCTTSNFVIVRDAFIALGGFDECLRYAEDQEILARLVDQGFCIRGIAQTLVKYRMNENGLSSDFAAMFTGWQSFARAWLSPEALASAEASYCAYLARRALRSGANMRTVRSYVRRGIDANRETFMAAGARSKMIICGAYTGGIFPSSVRRAVFA